MPRLQHLGSFAAGALLATTLAVAATQPFQAGAAPGDTDATYEPLNPCRLVDTRSDSNNVGARKAAIGPGETFNVQVTGTNGNCVDIPSDATAVAMNVTALNATARSNLRVFPGDVTDVPVVANLNYSETSPPTPNKVDSKLAADGTINIFNAFGTVDVIVDVVGVYRNTSLVEIESRLAALEARDTELATEIRDAIPTTVRRESGDRSIDENWSAVVSYTGINQTRDGTVLAFASTTAVESEAGADVICVITDSTTDFDDNDNMRWEAAGATAGSTAGEGDGSNLAGTESFSITAGTTGSYYLMCRSNAAVGGPTAESDSVVWDPQITLLFIPNR